VNKTENENIEKELASAEINKDADTITEREQVDETIASAPETTIEAKNEEVSEEKNQQKNKSGKKSKKSSAIELDTKLAEYEKAAETAEQNAPKIKKKPLRYIGLVLIILGCVFLWLFYSGFLNYFPYPAEFADTNWSAIYIKDDTLMARKRDGKIYQVATNSFVEGQTGNYTSDTLIEETTTRSQSGEALYYMENLQNDKDLGIPVGDLYVRFNDKKPILVETAVPTTNIMISKNGDVALFTKIILPPASQDAQATESPKIPLYMYIKGKGTVLVAEDSSYNINPCISYDGKYITYAQKSSSNDDPSIISEKIFVAKVGKNVKPVELADKVHAIYGVTVKGYVYYSQIIDLEQGVTGLFYKAANKEATLIEKKGNTSAKYIAELNNKFAFYIINEGEENMVNGYPTANFYSGQIGKENALLYNGPRVPIAMDVNNEKYLFAHTSAEDDTIVSLELNSKKQKKVIATNASANGFHNVLHNRDFSKITYITDYNPLTYSGTLNLSKTFLGKTENIVIENDVSLVYSTPDLKSIAYFKDYDPYSGRGTLYLFNGKKSVKVEEKVPIFSVKFTDDGKHLCYMMNMQLNDTNTQATASLIMIPTNNAAKKEVIGTDVCILNDIDFTYSLRDNGTVYYFKNYNIEESKGDLYVVEKKKAAKLVDSGVRKLILEEE